MINSIAFSAIIGYLLGSFQTAYFVSRLFQGIDIRQHGSSNPGASNVTTVMGWRYGVLTAVVDIFKSTLAVVLVKALFPGNVTLQLVAGAFSVVGHDFPFYLGFRGGKGTASYVGMFIGLDLRLALIAALALVTMTVVTDYIAAGSLFMAILMPVICAQWGYSLPQTGILAGIAVLALIKHWINLRRIKEGTETGLRKTLKKR